jgi:cytoskeletal protein CcmA (bactofilin family)
MFSKPATKTTAPRAEGSAEAALVRKPLPASLIGENVAMKGDLASDGEVQLDGAVLGDLKVGHLAIGETGQVEGVIEAESVEIRGRVAGAIIARTVKLYATARVDGDITHDQLTVEAGAHFAGRSLKRAVAVQEQLSLVVAAE